ncbi:MAG: hypothetical protein K2N41_09415 [Lachnospiraceae bacterium]|nr:hypothetical protein [Lachnospiraceae bacterium]
MIARDKWKNKLNFSGEKTTLQKIMIALLCNGKLHENDRMDTTVGGATWAFSLWLSHNKKRGDYL